MTVTTKNRSVKTSLTAKNGLSLALAILLSAGGALVVMVGGRIAIARTAAMKTAQLQTPGPGTPTVGPNAAPSPQLPDPSSEVSPTESPTLETAPPEAPVDLEPTPTETLTPEPEPTETIEPPPTESPILEPAPAPTEIPGATTSIEMREENIVFVKTAEGSATREIPGYAERFSDIVGSGRLLVNDANQVTGYYLTVSGLPASQTLPYHFHAAESSQPTSCEGDKDLVEGETAGEVITDLSEASPLQVGASGIASVGTASSPVQLASPVALEEIGYLNIHSPEGSPGPGIVCANVRLDPGGFVREMPEPVESEEGGDLEDETVGPNLAPEPQEPTLEP